MSALSLELSTGNASTLGAPLIFCYPITLSVMCHEKKQKKKGKEKKEIFPAIQPPVASLFHWTHHRIGEQQQRIRRWEKERYRLTQCVSWLDGTERIGRATKGSISTQIVWMGAFFPVVQGMGGLRAEMAKHKTWRNGSEYGSSGSRGSRR